MDNKAKRKLPNGRTLAFILQNDSGSTGLRFSLALSILTRRI